MTELTDIILAQIARSGPITIAEYMTQCLLHPEHGYYTTHQPLGSTGDFVTAPEISQMFGEMLGLCLAQAWMDQGAPEQFTLAELGPGRGTLMADILRATKAVAGFHAAAKIILVEVSPELRTVQEKTLDGYNVQWAGSVTELPEQALYLVANEFFDCLPISQHIRTEHGWQQQMVGANGGALGFILAGLTPTTVFKDADLGTVLELCPSAVALTADVARIIGAHGGAALILDYGDYQPKGDTFQAVHNHEKVDPLKDCGIADLTAHVNFQSLTQAAEAFAQVSGLTAQGILLERLGITARAQSLAAKLQGAALENHITAHRRLTHPAEMGQLFKAIAITPNGAAHPAGFD
ncbi:MAG: SAM-dependent methyltransferase [Amylibacter sp.]|nr:SAM-dependent methyltransferase [Amylibacter sp.]